MLGTSNSSPLSVKNKNVCPIDIVLGVFIIVYQNLKSNPTSILRLSEY
jgi:hypothetical protein